MNKPTPKNNVSARIDARLKRNLETLAQSQDIKVSKLVYNVLQDFWNNIHKDNWNYKRLQVNFQDMKEKHEQLQKSYSILESLSEEQARKIRCYERKNEELQQDIAVLKQEHKKQIDNLIEEHEEQIENLQRESNKASYNDYRHILKYDTSKALQSLEDTFQENDIAIINASLKVTAHNSKPQNVWNLKDINDLLTPKTA